MSFGGKATVSANLPSARKRSLPVRALYAEGGNHNNSSGRHLLRWTPHLQAGRYLNATVQLHRVLGRDESKNARPASNAANPLI